jgi:hypothetical protein
MTKPFPVTGDLSRLSSFHTNRKENTMTSNNPTESQASPRYGAAAGAAKVPGAILDPRATIEVASTGDGTVTDPSGRDTKPPGV